MQLTRMATEELIERRQLSQALQILEVRSASWFAARIFYSGSSLRCLFIDPSMTRFHPVHADVKLVLLLLQNKRHSQPKPLKPLQQPQGLSIRKPSNRSTVEID